VPRSKSRSPQANGPGNSHPRPRAVHSTRERVQAATRAQTDHHGFQPLSSRGPRPRRDPGPRTRWSAASAPGAPRSPPLDAARFRDASRADGARRCRSRVGRAGAQLVDRWNPRGGERPTAGIGQRGNGSLPRATLFPSPARQDVEAKGSHFRVGGSSSQRHNYLSAWQLLCPGRTRPPSRSR
jgi:hypothetical protein